MLHVEIEQLGESSAVLVTPEEYAEIYGRSASGVYRQIAKGKLPNMTVDGRLYIPMAGEQAILLQREPVGTIKIRRVAGNVWVLD